ncbi:unnamed protein product [Dovyalis caffra]|uniref:PGG domain-containing protein n=1 Tax=Dovyalis caffra TaxID=77055 RepID=A0AAV1S6Q6_9ROSI|nr:unnamed protein product [Dovyalis caffra]
MLNSAACRLDCQVVGRRSRKGHFLEIYVNLLQQDPLILHTLTLTTSITPLHIAALLGHAEFAMVVMQYCPRFATEVNQQGLTPIHLASANGHWEIVRDMLACKPDLAFIKDKDGKNFLHTAATRGRIQVLREVFSTESAKELTSNGETILHLAVKHNQYQALETSIQLVNQHQIGNELFNAKDKDGNTILHLACARKEPLMMRLLVSDQTNLDLDVNVGNSEGLTPLDIVERSMISSNEDQQIQEILKQAGAVPSGKAREKDSRHSTGKDILDPVKNGMGILAALFGTACFQLGMNPPGGVWSEWATGTNPNSTFHAASVDNNNSTYMDFWFSKLPMTKLVGPSHLKVSEACQHKPGLSIRMALVTNDAVARNIAFQAVIVAAGVLIAGIPVSVPNLWMENGTPLVMYLIALNGSKMPILGETLKMK